jgi:hypothetical protein
VIGGEKKIMDIVALAKFQEYAKRYPLGQDYSFLVHIENESSSKTDFNQRLFRYFCSLFLRYNRPIYPIVVFSYDSPQRLDKSDFVIDFPDKQVLKFDYEIVQLNRLNWRDFLQQKNPIAAALMSKMKIDIRDKPNGMASLRLTVKAQCLRLLVTLKLDPAKMQLISGFVDTYLKLNSQEESIFQSEISTIGLEEREQIMQITTSWKEEGRVEGREEGRIEGQSNTILRQLNRKLGNLPEEITKRIQSLELVQLDSLTEDLLDFETFDDLNRWLSNC